MHFPIRAKVIVAEDVDSIAAQLTVVACVVQNSRGSAWLVQTSLIRPHVVCAILRGVTFDTARFNSFIDLQDKLHQNLCRYMSRSRSRVAGNELILHFSY